MRGFEFLYFLGRIGNIQKDDLKQRINTLLEELNLKKFADEKIAHYSRGMLQKLALAQALINNPKILLLDEPTTGMDSFGISTLREKLIYFKNQNKTAFICSNRISELEKVCDRIAYIDDGTINFIELRKDKEEWAKEV